MRITLSLLLLSATLFQVACKKDFTTSEPTVSSQKNFDQIASLCEVKEDVAKTNAALARKTNRSNSPVVLLLDFNGHVLENTTWNPGQTWNCPAVPAAKLSKAMKDQIVAAVAEDYSAFKINVTRNEDQYNAAEPERRMRCVITHQMISQFGNIGGTGFIGSMAWGDDTPCFVFCDPLLYNAKYISGAVSHELGHSFGLQHQARFDAGCSMQEEYHSGQGDGSLSWAPIMGLSYYKSIVTWHEGSPVIGCNDIQDDVATILQTASLRNDDYCDVMDATAPVLPGSGIKNGRLEKPTDTDVFKKNETASKRITIQSGGNADIALEVYNMNGKLIAVHDDIDGTGVNAVVKGKKYLKVRVSNNQPFVPEGDGFGGYSITVSNL